MLGPPRTPNDHSWACAVRVTIRVSRTTLAHRSCFTNFLLMALLPGLGGARRRYIRPRRPALRRSCPIGGENASVTFRELSLFILRRLGRDGSPAVARPPGPGSP